MLIKAPELMRCSRTSWILLTAMSVCACGSSAAPSADGSSNAAVGGAGGAEGPGASGQGGQGQGVAGQGASGQGASGQGGLGQGGLGQGGLGQGGLGQGGLGQGAASGPIQCDGPGAVFATDVVATAFGAGQSYGQSYLPAIVLGPPQGGGCCMGSLDVASLGNGGSIVVAFAGNGIVDGPGVDFVVFENPFETGNSVFAELATVSVSLDGVSWQEFSCDTTEPPWGDCAGYNPVHLAGMDGPFDADTAGGDGFDLAKIGVDEARYVRIVDRADLDGVDGVFDLDAVGIVNPACP